MKALAFSPAAEGDLERIWDYSAENWGPDQAERYTEQIMDMCLALAAGTRRGRAVDIRAGYLKQAVGSHMIYFRNDGVMLHIMRILHLKQDTERHL